MITLSFESSVPYVAGDVLMVQPRNPDAVVSEFLSLIGLDPACQLRISVEES